MELKNTFVSGKMNKDLDERLVPKGEYIHAENIRIVTPETGSAGSVKMTYGNIAETNFTFGPNPRYLGHVVDNISNIIYWAVKSDTTDHILYRDKNTGINGNILHDNRPAINNVLNFQDGYPVDMKIINDTDNGRVFMSLNDGFNEPKFFNVDRAKTYGLNGFTFEDISLIKAPPINAPTLGATTEQSTPKELKKNFYTFAYRYKYLDGQYSALSPFSEVAFYVGLFDYDFDTGVNNSMFNARNDLALRVNTGDSTVVALDLIIKEFNSPTAFIVDTYYKSQQGWSDNATETIPYDSNKKSIILPPQELTRVFDNVPLKAKTQEFIGNRLVMANYTDNYDLTTPVGDFEQDITLSVVSTSGQLKYGTVRSNREYEIAISYLDGKGRKTTPITTPGNNIYLGNELADDLNKIKVTINNRGPSFAKYYRFYIKESATSYDIITPKTYYRDPDTIHVWVKLRGDDINKVSKGDFILVKSDTTGLLTAPYEAKVLEIETQPENFLGSGTQEKGVYMKLKEDGFELDSGNVTPGTFIIFETLHEENDSDIFYEVSKTYSMTNGLHNGGVSSPNDVSQTVSTPAEIELDWVNAFGWGNGFESYKIGDSFNEKEFINDVSPLSPINEYQQINRKASLTYSGVYERSTNINAINEFNLSLINYKDMDDAYGSIQLLHSKDTDLYVFQEDKTHRVLYQKDVLFDADGQGNIRESQKVLGQEIPYAGEYGINKNPESFAFYGNRIYHLDLKRGALMRLGQDGYTEISRNGMFNSFRNKSTAVTKYPGGYNPYDDVYMISHDNKVVAYSEMVKGFTSFYTFDPEAIFYLNNNMYSVKGGNLYRHDVEGSPVNTYYGVSYPSKIKYAINDNPSDIKVLKAMSQEASSPWDAVISMYEGDNTVVLSSTLTEDDFIKKEGKWYAYIRRNEQTGGFGDKSVYGIGEISSITIGAGTLRTITVSGGVLNSQLDVGNEVYTTNGTLQGVITKINDTSIEINADAGFNAVTTNFIYGKKDNRIEGSNLRGYTAVVDLEITDTVNKELFATNVEVFKSFQ